MIVVVVVVGGWMDGWMVAVLNRQTDRGWERETLEPTVWFSLSSVGILASSALLSQHFNAEFAARIQSTNTHAFTVSSVIRPTHTHPRPSSVACFGWNKPTRPKNLHPLLSILSQRNTPLHSTLLVHPSYSLYLPTKSVPASRLGQHCIGRTIMTLRTLASCTKLWYTNRPFPVLFVSVPVSVGSSHICLSSSSWHCTHTCIHTYTQVHTYR